MFQNSTRFTLEKNYVKFEFFDNLCNDCGILKRDAVIEGT